MSCISIILSIIAFLIINLFAISYYDSCRAGSTDIYCKYQDGRTFNYLEIIFGVISIIIVFIFFVVNLGAINGGCLQFNKQTAVQNPYL